ncbi:cobalt-precorrin-6A reductase [Aliiroseovarius sp. KMU-50]|uniref:Cobalt-precorrin-6A reductase n=1 Tax=Aliiroseovarius salicola TaxID=3009082 RepID=A0ABT4W234_9RHOB|nr:cobalt-precorrin-6A reductase [Aliiroseovarius sp. KMU-50]MDA5094573.1 cobalt-precorrin-6A reductase [Aliiroseovarius sp. KMU-50]
MIGRILLLAGTTEAHELAARLAEQGYDVLASLAGVTKSPRRLPVQTRHGGFGGRDGQNSVMRDEKISLVIDATHPFATTISDRTADICRELSIPYLRFSRPAWEPEAGEHWHEVNDIKMLATVIPPSARVFLATGKQSEAIAEALPYRVLFCRKVDGGSEPFALSGGWIAGRPPYTKEEEIALFQELGVTWLVAKNAGGAARAKLAAARDLGISVAMISRPPAVHAPTVQSVEEVLVWVRAHEGARDG